MTSMNSNLNNGGLKRGVSQSISRKERPTLLAQASVQLESKAKEKTKEGTRTKSATVTDPIRIKRLLDKSVEENARLVQQLKDLQEKFDREQEKSQAQTCRIAQLEQTINVMSSENQQLEQKRKEEVCQLQHQADHEKQLLDESWKAKHDSAIAEQQSECTILKKRLFRALHALEQYQIDPETLKPSFFSENLQSCQADYTQQLQEIQTTCEEKKHSLLSNMDQLDQLVQKLSHTL